MHALVTCKNGEDPFKNEGSRVVKTFHPLLVYGDYSRRSRAANSAVHGSIRSTFELIRYFMNVLVIC